MQYDSLKKFPNMKLDLVSEDAARTFSKKKLAFQGDFYKYLRAMNT